MHKRKQPRLGDLEMQIMNVLWERGPSTVRDVLKLLPTKPLPAYTTVLTMLREMQDKGFVIRDESNRTHVYSAAAQEKQVKRHLLRDLIRITFRGSPESLLMHLLEDEKLSEEELSRIGKFIASKSRKE